jgi:hypothetical protein
LIPVRPHHPNQNIFLLWWNTNADKPFETLTYLSETQSDLINRKWSLSDTILIGDVNVMARNKKVDTRTSPSIFEADFVYDMKVQNKRTWQIFLMPLRVKYQGVILDQNTMTFFARGDRLKILFGWYRSQPTDSNQDDLPSQRFEKVEYIKSGMFCRYQL